jgi:hypothetical protein
MKKLKPPRSNLKKDNNNKNPLKFKTTLAIQKEEQIDWADP